jgi:putative ABC transport system permease protein
MTHTPPSIPNKNAPPAANDFAIGEAGTPVLEVNGVTKSYPGEPPVHALREVTLTIRQGELVGIVGPSGSGKTTLLQLMGTLDQPTSGRVRITGLDVATMADDDVAYLRATRIGFIFQHFFLAEHATVLDNVADGLLYSGIPLEQRRERALDALELVGLAQRPSARPTQLSGGQRQRVAIARALVGEPAIVLADEPTGNLDQATGHAILQLVDQLHQAGSTIVVITHDHAIAERMPRKVEILDGRIVADTTPAKGPDPRLHPCAPGAQPPTPGTQPTASGARRPGALVTATATPGRRRLPLSDLTRLSTVGLRTRKLRAGLSALGIAIGVAAIVAVLGLSASSQAGLLNEINQLGTNLLTASNGQSLTGAIAELPISAPAMIARIAGVQQVQSSGTVSDANAYRSPYIPSVDTNGLAVQAASLNLLPVLATSVAQGHYLNAATAQEPVAVLGAAAAQLLGIDHIYPGERMWIGGQWFYLAGILKPAVLASAIDTSVLVGYPAAKKYLQFDGHPSTIYLRAQTDQVTAVDNLLAATANPESPSEVNVSQPSDALVAQADAKSALNGLFLGLGAIALLVGAVGVANIMIISVLERRSEIGLRRALGATKGHIRTQFLSEAILLGLLGGAVGVALGGASTAVYAHTKHWATIIPTEAWAGGLAASLIIGAAAGLIPALRAARLSPTQALWSI